MRLLSIDPGSGMGLGLVVMHSKVLVHRETPTLSIKDVGLGEFLHVLEHKLLSLHERFLVDSIAVEKVTGGAKGLWAAQVYGAQLGIVCKFAYDHALDLYQVPVQSGKKALGSFASGKAKNTAHIAAARVRGYNIQTDDEACALGLALAIGDTGGAKWLTPRRSGSAARFESFDESVS